MLPGGGELFVILLVALVIFGPHRLPEISRTIGGVMRDLRRASQQLVDSISMVDEDDYRSRSTRSHYNEGVWPPRDGES